MILKRLKVRNIRSYEEADVTFPNGVILFEGDIGSGKSSLLIAIEFALFGFSNVKPKYLLRHGANEGMAEVTFVLDGTEYLVHREIMEKGTSAKRGSNFISVDGQKEADYASEEMKARVLQILGFNEPPDPRASSVIYRFAVFTPQEEMKVILEQRPQDRLQTLRRAFRIDEYKTARDNADLVRREAQSRIGALDEHMKRLPELETRMKEMSEEYKNENEALISAGKGLKESEAKMARLKSRLDHLEKKRDELTKAEKEVAKKESELGQVDEALEDSKEAEKELATVEKGLEKVRPKLVQLKELRTERKRLEGEIERFRKAREAVAGLDSRIEAEKEKHESLGIEMKRLEFLEEQRTALANKTDPLGEMRDRRRTLIETRAAKEQEATGLDAQGRTHRKELKDLEGLEGAPTCPRCRQPLDNIHLDALKADEEKEVDRLHKLAKAAQEEADSAASKTARLDKEIAVLESLLEEKGGLEKEIVRLKAKDDEMRAIEKRIIELNGKKVEIDKGLREGKDAEKRLLTVDKRLDALADTEAEAAKMEQMVTDAKRRVKEKDALVKKRKDIETQLKDLQERLEKSVTMFRPEMLEEAKKAHEDEIKAFGGFERTVVEKGKNVKRMTRELEAMVVEVETSREKVRSCARLADVRTWLKEFYIPALEDIERNVMGSMNEEFERLFAEWFHILMDTEEIAVRLDEEFTPVIEQNGYEVPHAHLSGGERTSVAFAYRLALNALVRRTVASMKENMIILDEPTDGFSKEQLSRMRDVLDALGCDQTIIVTHERELASVADHVFRVVKEGGSSKVIIG